MSDPSPMSFPGILKALELLEEIIKTKEREKRLMKELDDLTAQVTASESVEASAVLLINGIAARIAAAGVDPTKLAALTISLKAEADTLSAAVAANTPAA